jgi:hypothetical protein
MIEFEYLRRASPPTLAAVSALLARLAGLEASPGEVVSLLAAGDLYDEHDLASYLWLIGHCIVQGTSQTAARFVHASLPDLRLSSGLEFMRQTELLTRETLSLWGRTDTSPRWKR